jgi:hypothetical protein
MRAERVMKQCQHGSRVRGEAALTAGINFAL